jgi:hypothetical protein
LFEQSEYDQWCLTNKTVFESVDASERDRCKSELCLATGGNPLLLDSFRDEFESTVRCLLQLERSFFNSIVSLFFRRIRPSSPALMLGSSSK